MKKITKVMSVFLAVLMAFGVMSVAVNAEEVTDCEHDFDKWIISQNETCADPGIKYRKCKICDAIETGLVPALGHAYGEGVVTEPTCGQKGCTTYTCANCGEEKIEDEKPALAHTYGEWKISAPATCTEAGLKVRECSVCDATAAGHTESEVIPAAGHKMVVKEVVLPTYTAEGYRVYKCENCEETENKDYTPVLEGKVESVELGEKIVVQYEETAKIDPAVKMGGSVAYTVEFKSEKENVATVDAEGNIIGKGMGKTVITCTVTDEYGNTVTDTVEVQVKFSMANWFTIIRQVLKAAIDIVIGGLFGKK